MQMKRQIKMIGLDLDGTLLTDKKELLPYTRKILDEVISRDIIVLPVTGRSANEIPEMIMNYPGIYYAVTSNGARVLDVSRNEIIFEHLLPHETSMQILQILGKYDVLREIHYEGQGYLDREKLDNIEHYHHDPVFWEYVRITRKAVSDIMELAENKHCAMDKLVGIFADEKEHKQAWSELNQRADISISVSGGNNIEVTAADYVGLSNEEEGAAKAIETLLGLTEFSGLQ